MKKEEVEMIDKLIDLKILMMFSKNHIIRDDIRKQQVQIMKDLNK